MNLSTLLQEVSMVGAAIGGNFGGIFAAIAFIQQCITKVEAMHGLTGPQKLDAVKQMIHDGVANVPTLAKLTHDPIKLDTAINQLVAVANLFIK